MTAQRVEVVRGTHRDKDFRFGPLPGYRLGDVVAYEFELPERFEPWPGRTRLERIFVLLDLGVSFSDVCWAKEHKADGSVGDHDAPGTWYVDLITVEVDGDDRFIFRDLYIDVMVPVDGRHYRMLDLHEFAEAIESGALPVNEAVDALRRWQLFLDRHLHADRYPVAEWSDFPPASIRQLLEIPPPFGTPVRWED